jgi:hypothetical protein
MPEMGNRLRPAAGGAQLPPRTALPEDGYDAGAKKPVADPKSWRVRSGKDWVTSKPQELENLVQTGGWVEAEIGEMRVSIPTG